MTSGYEVLVLYADTSFYSAILYSKHEFVFQTCEIIVTLDTVLLMSTNICKAPQILGARSP